MADKRISQLIERTDIANNDVLPIVASGATTTNKVTVSTLQDWMQDNLDVGVTSVGLSVPSAFTVSGSPVTTSGNITISGAGTTAQYIRGDGSLADFPQSSGGGGASVSYYLNGSVSQGTIGGIAYREMNKTPILGAGTDFTINANGYIASFITDAGDPSLLLIPGGNWNFETYFAASSGGGSPSFYVELYKVDSGGTATLIASNSANPELIAFGTTTTAYFSSLAVPATTLTLTDRLALRYYVTHAGRTITLHTENSHLCQIITTFTTGLTALNGLTAQVQNFATGTSGTDFGISSSTSTHTFNLPTASATNRGALSSADWITFNGKQNAITLTTTGSSGAATLVGSTLNIPNYTTAMQNQYVPYTGAIGSVTLGANNLSASTILVDGPAPTSGGFLGFKQATSVNTGQGGYTSIAAIGTNEMKFTFAQPSNFKEFSFSTQSITAGVSGGRIYTMPDASGTLALTSQLGDYVTIATSQTITGAKTFETTTSTFALMNSTNANGGVLSFRRNGTNVGHIGNSAQLGAGVLDAIEVRSGTGSSVILKTDGGQLTLANGGGVTLTGALTGTTASFGNTGSGTFTIQASNNDQSNARINITNTGSGGQSVNLVAGIPNVSNSGFAIAYGNTTILGFASSGVATFTSNVIAQSGVEIPNGQFYRARRASGNLLIDLLGIVSGTDNTRLISTGDFDIVNGALSSQFKIASTGAATFSSSVTAASVITSDSASTAALPATSGSTQSGGHRLRLTTNGASTAVIDYGTAGGSGGWIQAAIKDSLGTTLPLLLNPNGGNVGIGTASPAYSLDVHTNNSVYNTRFYQPSSSTSAYNSIIMTGAMTSAVGYAGIGGSATGNTSFRDNFVVGTQSSHPLVLNTNDTERMRITSGGNVGIGTNNPSRSLDVNGSARANNFASIKDRVSVPSSTFTTFFTPSLSGLYLARVYLSGNNSQFWSAVIIFEFNASTILVVNQTNGINVSTNVSGTNIQVRQIGGSTFDFDFEILRIG